MTLDRDFFARPALEVAPDVLGCVVEHETPEGVVAVRLTEVEAYEGAQDPGSHAYRGPTARTTSMFGPPGHVYVYFTYGMHWCMNLVCATQGTASAVLVRAGEVVTGAAVASARRPKLRPRDLARGPARLTAALGIDGTLDGVDLFAPASPLRIHAGDRPLAVARGPRVGVGGAGAAFPWRFWAEGEPTVSVYRPAVQRRRSGRLPA